MPLISPVVVTERLATTSARLPVRKPHFTRPLGIGWLRGDSAGDPAGRNGPTDDKSGRNCQTKQTHP